MMVLDVLIFCLNILLGGVIMGITIALLAVIVYIVAGVISVLVQTFKEVQAKNKLNKAAKFLNNLAEATELSKQQKDSR